MARILCRLRPISGLLLILAPALALAATPPLINLQGQVRDPSGAPAPGPVDIRVGIWDSAEGGALLYEEKHLGTPLAAGVFDVLLGTGSDPVGGFDAGTFLEPDRWLELTIDGQTLMPRQRVASVAYALPAQFAERAANADTLGGMDATAFVSRVGGVFDGNVLINGPNGGGNILLSSTAGQPDNGLVAALNAEGKLRAEMFVDSDGNGVVSSLSANGTIGALLGEGKSGGLFGLSNSAGEFSSLLASDGDGGGLFDIIGPNGSDNVLLGTSEGDPNQGAVAVLDRNGLESGTLEVAGDAAGFLRLRGPSGNSNVELSHLANSPDRGALTLRDEQGITKVLLLVDAASQGIVDVVSKNQLPAIGLRVREKGDGVLFIEGPQGEIGNLNVLMGAVEEDPNRGSVAVQDAGSVTRAGMFVNASNRGQIFADVKNFIVDHPRRPGMQIVYASLEGPEVAMYHRGVVHLQDGRATIALPEHFAALAVPGTITVQLTPASLESLGLAAAAIHDDAIDIGELYHGHGSYDVYFLVHAVRRGYENYQPVVAKSESQSIPALAAALATGGGAAGNTNPLRDAARTARAQVEGALRRAARISAGAP